MNEKNVLNGEKRKKYINDVVVSLKTCRQLRNKDKKSGTNIDYKTKNKKERRDDSLEKKPAVPLQLWVHELAGISGYKYLSIITERICDGKLLQKKKPKKQDVYLLNTDCFRSKDNRP